MRAGSGPKSSTHARPAGGAYARERQDKVEASLADHVPDVLVVAIPLDVSPIDGRVWVLPGCQDVAVVRSLPLGLFLSTKDRPFYDVPRSVAYRLPSSSATVILRRGG